MLLIFKHPMGPACKGAVLVTGAQRIYGAASPGKQEWVPCRLPLGPSDLSQQQLLGLLSSVSCLCYCLPVHTQPGQGKSLHFPPCLLG